MSKSNDIRPERQLIHGRHIDIVGRIQADETGYKGPSSEGATGEGGYGGRSVGTFVDALGVFKGCIGLDAIAESDNGDLEEGLDFWY